jgi:hypothetical protein
MQFVPAKDSLHDFDPRIERLQCAYHERNLEHISVHRDPPAWGVAGCAYRVGLVKTVPSVKRPTLALAEPST